MFKVGDKVEKHTGDYNAIGEVRSDYTTPDGKQRFMVALTKITKGCIMHTLSADNIRDYPGVAYASELEDNETVRSQRKLIERQEKLIADLERDKSLLQTVERQLRDKLENKTIECNGLRGKNSNQAETINRMSAQIDVLEETIKRHGADNKSLRGVERALWDKLSERDNYIAELQEKLAQPQTFSDTIRGSLVLANASADEAIRILGLTKAEIDHAFKIASSETKSSPSDS